MLMCLLNLPGCYKGSLHMKCFTQEVKLDLTCCGRGSCVLPSCFLCRVFNVAEQLGSCSCLHLGADTSRRRAQRSAGGSGLLTGAIRRSHLSSEYSLKMKAFRRGKTKNSVLAGGSFGLGYQSVVWHLVTVPGEQCRAAINLPTSLSLNICATWQMWKAGTW